MCERANKRAKRRANFSTAFQKNRKIVQKMMFRYLVVKTYQPKSFNVVFKVARGINQQLFGFCKMELNALFCTEYTTFTKLYTPCVKKPI